MRINDIILQPVITEKAMDNVQKGTYSFYVSTKSNKNSVTVAVESLFGVKVHAVRIVSRKGKMRRVGKKMQYKKLSDRKIAYVSLSEGTIDVFPKQ